MFDTDFVTLVCDTCGDKGDGETVAAFCETLERLRREKKRGAVMSFLDGGMNVSADVSFAREGVLGLSRDYLSRLMSGSRVPDLRLCSRALRENLK